MRIIAASEFLDGTGASEGQCGWSRGAGENDRLFPACPELSLRTENPTSADAPQSHENWDSWPPLVLGWEFQSHIQIEACCFYLDCMFT